MARASFVPSTRWLDRLAEQLLKIVAEIPHTSEPVSHIPAVRCRAIVRQAAAKAASIAGTLALPPGPLGIATILPDLYAIWRVQAQMVADIAAIYGKTADLSREQMLYCLFRHVASHLFNDLVVRVGGAHAHQAGIVTGSSAHPSTTRGQNWAAIGRADDFALAAGYWGSGSRRVCLPRYCACGKDGDRSIPQGYRD